MMRFIASLEIKKSGTIAIVLLLLISGIFLFDTVNAQELQPLPTVSSKTVRLVEGSFFCYAGYGTQSTIFQVSDHRVAPEDSTNPYLPFFQPFSTTYLKTGCYLNSAFFEFSLIEDSSRFENTVFLGDAPYNSIRFKTTSLSVGYAFPLAAHFLYLDVGVAYANIEYNLGLYDSPFGSGIESEMFTDDSYFLHSSLKLFITHFMFLDWKLQRPLESDCVMWFVNQFGMNFMVRF